MSGIQFVTDEKGRKVAVLIDLKKHHELWEDIEDVLVSRSRRHEKRIPLEKVKAALSRAANSHVSSLRSAPISALPCTAVPSAEMSSESHRRQPA